MKLSWIGRAHTKRLVGSPSAFYAAIPCFPVGLLVKLVQIGDLTLPTDGLVLLAGAVVLYLLHKVFSYLFLETVTRIHAVTDDMIKIGKKNGVYER
jgi:hypothetical protein